MAALKGRERQAAGRDRLPRRAISRRAAQGDSRDRRDARNGGGPQILDAIGDRRFGGSAVRGSSDPEFVWVRAECGSGRSAVLPRERLDNSSVGSSSGFEPRTPSHRTPTAAAKPPDYIYDADTPRLLTTPKHFAYVKIAEGCDYTCAFCIIPTLRGSYRSRTIDSIVREARSLAERGVRELLLISQDTSFYGIDRGERGSLARLLRELNAVEGLELDPAALSLPDHDHRRRAGGDGRVREGVPLRRPAAAARVGRRAEADAAAGQPADLRQAARPDPRSRPRRHTADDFIVGFPGETDADFAELEAFVQETGFDHVGVFTYSHEEGTRAFALADDVPARSSGSAGTP